MSIYYSSWTNYGNVTIYITTLAERISRLLSIQLWEFPLYIIEVSPIHTKTHFFWCYFILDKFLLISYCNAIKTWQWKVLWNSATAITYMHCFYCAEKVYPLLSHLHKFLLWQSWRYTRHMFKQCMTSSNFPQTPERWSNQEKANCLNTSCSISISLLAIDGTIHSFETCLLFCCGVNMRRAWSMHSVK